MQIVLLLASVSSTDPVGVAPEPDTVVESCTDWLSIAVAGAETLTVAGRSTFSAAMGDVDPPQLESPE